MLDVHASLTDAAALSATVAIQGDVPRMVAVLSAGIHEPSTTSSLAADLATAAEAAAAQLGFAIATRVIEIRDLAADLAIASIGEGVSTALGEAIGAVTGADALIAVTPVFAASYAGLFKSFFDVLDPGTLTGLPTAIGATGGSVRHSLVIDYALRPLMAYFRADVVPTGVFVAPDDGPGTARSARTRNRIDRAGGELAAALASRPARALIGDRQRRP